MVSRGSAVFFRSFTTVLPQSGEIRAEAAELPGMDA